ncbi:methionine biosynthesis protein MetW [Candidatus Pelagadaptatus aseana]|uniref:methionine biosynthesis protein MetW n=1 Tax=Candidatus Pelagadaptatus aseana TaxID=3120508 RepID=UPI003C6F67BA
MRSDLDIIVNWIPNNSRLLDLACGEGELLARLKQDKQVEGYGLEIDNRQINACIQNNVNAIYQDITQGLDNFADASFDMVVMTQALQVMREPHKVLADMLRIGKECIVTFPNFGHWKARWHLLTKGRMPVSDLLPYEWYDTPNIHFCTFKDFEVLCHEMDIDVLHREVVAEAGLGEQLKNVQPNLFGVTALYHLRKK